MKSLSIVLFGCLTSTVAAADYRVGSARELVALTSKLAPGDVVVLRDGEWRDADLTLRGRGDEKHPIVFRAETSGKTVFTGRSTLVVDGEWLVLSGIAVRDGAGPKEGIALRGEHNRITECAMVGGTYKHFLRVFGVKNRVDHCYFAEKTSGEPTLQVESEPSGPNEHRIDHNHFGHRPPLGRNGGETIRIGYSGQSMNVSRTVVEENLFEQCDGEIEIISSKSCENVYRGNTFFECAGMLTLRHGNRCVVDGNFFIGHHKKQSGGVRVIGEDHVVINNYVDGVERGGFWVTAGVPNSPLNGYFAAKRCLIAFNTVVDSDGPCVDVANGLGESNRSIVPEMNTVANNLFRPAAQGVLVIGKDGAGWSWIGNLAAGGPDDGTREPPRLGIRRVDIAGARDPAGVWRPSPTSAVVNAAKDVFAVVATDCDGQPRGQGADVGCDEISEAPVTRKVLTAADVGPSWRRASR